MTARKKIGSFMGGAAMIAGAVGMTAGLAPASAAPSQSPGSMPTIVDQNITGAGDSRVIVQGVCPKQKPEAVGYLNNLTAGCGGMHYITRGDDGNERICSTATTPECTTTSTASLRRIQRYRAKAERARTIRSAPLNP